MTPEKLKEIQSQQVKALQACYSLDECAKLRTICNNHTGPINSGILYKLVSCEEADVDYALGDLGLKLKEFAQCIDLQDPHPDLRTMLSGTLVGDSGFSRDISDLYDLMIYARSKGCSPAIIGNMRRMSGCFENTASVFSHVGNPLKNLQNARLVNDPALRREIRSQKKFQAIGLRVEFQHSTWIDHPEDFVYHYRYSNRFEKELADAKSRAEHFRDLNLPLMAAEVEKSVSELTNQTQSGQYLGFNKVTLTSAAISLAKLLGYQFESNGDESVICDYSTGSRKLYCPIAYTLEEAICYISQELSDLYAFLENFPEMGHKPIFDHYRVLVPNFDYSFGTLLGSFQTTDGSLTFHIKQENNPDFTMIKEGHTVGLLLGEKDGQMYFISYWM